jgi:hypothetical protein
MFSNKFNIGVLKHPGYNIGGGIGEAALIGAAFGGAKSLATGEDVLEGALLGGITGGAMSGITGAVMGKEALTATQGVAGAADDLALATTQGTIQNGVIQGANTGLNVAGAGGMTGTQGIAGYADDVLAPNFAQAATQNAVPVSQSMAQTLAKNAGAGGYTAGQAIPAGTDISQGVANAGRLAEQAAAGSVNGNIAAQMPSGGGGLKEFLTKPGYDARGTDLAPEGSMTNDALNWWDKQGMLGRTGIAGAAGYGMGALEPRKIPELPEKEKSKLHGYDPDNFTPYIPETPNPYYSAKYAAEGGTMQSYAQGGIAALAQGGMGGNQGYPQGRLDTTQYATPSQMPTSAQVVNADYEVPTDPYMGSPLKMAEGGVARYAFGGSAGAGSQVYYDPQKGQYYTMGNGMDSFARGNPVGAMNAMAGAFGGEENRQYIDGSGRPVDGGGMGKFGGDIQSANGTIGDNFQASQAKPEVYQQAMQAAQVPMTDYNPNTAAVAAQSVASPAYDAMMQGVAPQDFNRVFSQITSQTPYAPPPPKTGEVEKKARGGIIGYAGGGIPQARNLSELNTGDGSPTGGMGRASIGGYSFYDLQNNARANNTPAAPTTFLSPDFQTSQATPNMYQPQYEQYASGGIAGYSLGGYAAGGNPRLLKGPGDGMSDNIPATIGGRQPARLADGEFVVPADVVSHLGNGSTDAGAKHLYKMMDKVRTARTGKKAQGKQIKPEKYLPR